MILRQPTQPVVDPVSTGQPVHDPAPVRPQRATEPAAPHAGLADTAGLLAALMRDASVRAHQHAQRERESAAARALQARNAHD